MSYQSKEFVTGQKLLASDMQAVNDALVDQQSGIKSLQETVNEQAEDITALLGKDDSLDISQLGLTEENGVLYVVNTETGEHSEEGWEITGTGGGGSYLTGTMKLKLTSAASATVSEDAGYTLQWEFTSTDGDGDATGDGSAVITVGGSTVYNATIAQGEGSYSVAASLLSVGTNVIVLTVTDADGRSLSRTAKITVVELSISSTFDDSTTYSGDITFRYTPVGSGVTKIVHFLLDGVEVATEEVTSSGKTRTVTLPSQEHGDHSLQVYLTATIDGAAVTSNVLYYQIAWVDASSTAPVIAIGVQQGVELTQGDSLTVPYLVHDPSTSFASVTRQVIDEDGEVYAEFSATVERTQQTWVVSDLPTGAVTLRFTCGETVREVAIVVNAYELELETNTEGQVYYLTAMGRSNTDSGKEDASYEGIAATLSGFNYSSDGWMGTTLRFQTGDSMVIDTMPFDEDSDIRSTGWTGEFEFTTIAVRDPDCVIIGCMADGRGFEITPTSATFGTQQNEKTIYYKEGERVRVTIAVESKDQDRMVRLCVNGVPSGVFQYPAGDDFEQLNPVMITVGHDDCSFDLHCIRLHNAALTTAECIGNWINDRDTLLEKIALAEANSLFDANGDLDAEKVGGVIPCLYITGDETTSKKDLRDVVAVLNHSDTARAFMDALAQWYIQGTSSTGFPVKNYRLQLSEAVDLLGNDALQSLLCLKANFMDSSNAMNTGTAMLFDWVYRQMGWLTPPMEDDEKVRMCIAGYPLVLWWRETADDAYSFHGIYTINYDKKSGATEEIYGAENALWYEFANNTTDHCLFKDASIDDNISTDIEVRYGEEDWEPISKAIQFVIDCEGNPEKFEAGLDAYFDRGFLVAYYVLSEIFGMVDSRGKNMVMASWPDEGGKLYPVWYDMDTQAGRNNEGLISFPYDVEAHSQYSTAMAFNAEGSALWKLVEDALGDEIEQCYQNLRSNVLTLANIRKYIVEPYSGTIPAVVFAEDGVYKYERPTLEEGSDQLALEQGDWAMYYLRWVALSLAYRDSKYLASPYTSDRLSMRIYSPTTDGLTDEEMAAKVAASLAAVPVDHDFDLAASIHYFPSVLYGANGYRVQGECEEGGSVHIPVTTALSNTNDLETYIEGAGYITDIGDISDKYPGSVDLSAGVLLRYAKIGNRTEGYYNANLMSVSFGNNTMLEEITLSNCPNLTGSVSVENCGALREFYAEGTNLTSVTFPDGGNMTALYLPETIIRLEVKNQPGITDFAIEGCEKLETLVLENALESYSQGIVEKATNLVRLRLTRVNWKLDEPSLLFRLMELKGIDANGNNTDQVEIAGQVYIACIGANDLQTLWKAFPDLTITVPDRVGTFVNADGTVLYVEYAESGTDFWDPVASGEIAAPEQEPSASEVYTWSGWSGDLSASGSVTITATYTAEERVLTVTYMNGDTVVDTQQVAYGGSCAYGGSGLSKSGCLFTGWDNGTEDGAVESVTEDMVLYAVWEEVEPVQPAEILDLDEYDYAYSEDSSDSSAYSFAELQWICESGEADQYLTVGSKIKLVPNSTAISDTSIVMVLRSFKHFRLADGSGDFAKTTWFMEGLLTTSRVMNSTEKLSSDGENYYYTGGGYLSSDLDTWLEGTLFPSLSAKWQAIIKEVAVLANDGYPNNSIISGNRHLYLMSYQEAFGSTLAAYQEVDSEAAETQFSTLYSSPSDRIKYKSSGSAYSWWLRSAFSGNTNSFRSVNTAGGSSSDYAYANYSVGVCFGISI